MKTGSTLARLTALLVALPACLGANADTAAGCEGPNHYILSKCEHELRLEWMAVPDSLLAHHRGHTATLLDDGRVLVVGGGTWRHDPVTRTNIAQPSGAEIYDPVSRTWSLTAPMNVPRDYGVAVRLLDGRVLMLGGERPTRDLAGSAEIFDPATGTWTPTASQIIPRVSFTATLLANGEVLVAGGVNWEIDMVAVAEIYNPETGQWRTTGGLREPRWAHAATALPDGKILVAGGNSDSFLDEAAQTAERFDPETGTWSRAGDITQGWLHTLTPIGDGRVLVAGGTQHKCPGGPCSETDVETTLLYDARSGTWMDTGTLISPRHGHLAVPIRGRGVLLVGGRVGVTPVPRYSVAPVDGLELFDLGTLTWKEVAATNTPPTSLSNYHSATQLADGTWLLIGDAEGARAVQLRH